MGVGISVAWLLASASLSVATAQQGKPNQAMKSRYEWRGRDGDLRFAVTDVTEAREDEYDAELDLRSSDLGHFKLSFRQSVRLQGFESRIVDLNGGWFARYSTKLGLPNGVRVPGPGEFDAMVELLRDERTIIDYELETPEGVVWHFVDTAKRPRPDEISALARSMTEYWRDAGISPSLPTGVRAVVKEMREVGKDRMREHSADLRELSLVLGAYEQALQAQERSANE